MLHAAQPATQKPATHRCKRPRCGEYRFKPMIVAPDPVKMDGFWNQYPKGYLMLVNKWWLIETLVFSGCASVLNHGY
jgi:hypothetical protein